MGELAVSDGVSLQDGDGLEHLSITRIGRLTGVGTRTLHRMLADGRFPPADLRIGCRILRWRRSTVQQWVDAQRDAAALRRTAERQGVFHV